VHRPPPTDVLLVEDDPDYRSLIARLLRRDGRFEPREADVTRWFHEVCSCQPAVLLLDLTLDGVDTVAALPQVVASCPTTMVTALTARRPEQYEAAVRCAGAFAFYEKHNTACLPDHLAEDRDLFERALTGEEVVAPSALARRPGTTPPVTRHPYAHT
jgi:CheY-like chemotaxis protein